MKASYECFDCGRLVPEGGHHVCKPPRDPFVRLAVARYLAAEALARLARVGL